MKFKKVLSVFSFLLVSVMGFAGIQDSIGIEKKDGKVYILHKVEAKETLYSISKKYKASVDEIRTANSGAEAGLQIGQTIRIPYKGTLPSNNSYAVKSNGGKHTVKAKETWYAISKTYGITVEDLKKANPGVSEGLKIGQVLNLPSGKKPETKTAETKTVTKVAEKDPKIAEKPEEEDEENETIVPHRSVGNYDKLTEAGMAQQMESEAGNPKYLAQHKTAPVGTIIQVVNEENGQKIFVRVVGKLETAEDKVIVKLSQKAMERLHAVDKKIKVSISYIK